MYSVIFPLYLGKEGKGAKQTQADVGYMSSKANCPLKKQKAILIMPVGKQTLLTLKLQKKKLQIKVA